MSVKLANIRLCYLNKRPARVIKEPPYSVKESGYAGFTLPIEIYLRNKDDPKKITFNYDLNLQQSGPAIFKVQKEKYVFTNPGEDFRLKLLKGGGIIVNTPNTLQDTSRDSRPTSEEKSQLVSKPRLGGSDFIKKPKPKPEEPHVSSFQALFGPPITKTSKTSLDPKLVSKDKNSNINKSGTSEKEKLKNKHSPHKDKEKDKEKFRDKEVTEKKNKDEKKREDKKRERSKDREERIKEKKEKREKSPKVRSPTPTKRPLSPKRPPSPLPKYKDDKKIEIAKEKKSLDDREKLEKKVKKEKREKDKERKENKHKDRESQKVTDQKENKGIVREKEKHREPSPLQITKIERKEKLGKEKEVPKEIKEPEQTDNKNNKIKGDKCEEKPKHKHKKKDKEKKEKEKVNEKEKAYKPDKKGDKNNASTTSKYVDVSRDVQKENDKVSLFDSPKYNPPIESKAVGDKPKKPLNTLIAECIDSDSSNSSISSPENLFQEPTIRTESPKKDLLETQPIKPNSEKKPKRDKSKKNKEKRADKDGEKKRKRKIDANHVEEPIEKISKEDSSNSNLKESDGEPHMQQAEVREENYEDYMNLLRELQHKILMLQDNSELQRVVQLIAETGRFEISAQTFDFDLCLLERSTIKQLQNFFESTS